MGFLDKRASSLPPIIAMILVVGEVIVLTIGFRKYGIAFIDKGIIDHESKARLDNELRGM
jgi:uncharacterized membrane protein